MSTPFGERGHDARAVPPAATRPLDARRSDDEPRAALSPAAHPSRPALGVPPIGRSGCGDLLKHQQFGAMELTDDRYIGATRAAASLIGVR